MVSRQSSLKSIADKAGVSITTVHRALTGKKDCSAQMRERILAIAAEEGYEFNYYAASLRRTRLKIAVIMGTHDRDSRFFVDRIADGIQRCIDANSQFNIDYRFLTYTGRDMTSAKAGQIVSDLKKETFDGVLMHVLKLPDKAIEDLSKALSGDMPVVAVELNPTSRQDVCTISTDNEVAGRMAGEIVAKLTRSSGKVYIFSQEMNLSDANAIEARREILSRRDDLEVVDIPLPLTGDESVYSTIRDYVNQRPAAIYATCARHTVRVVKALGGIKKVGTVIGSELFDESREAMHKGIIDAVIDKRPGQMGYRAMDMLLATLIRKVPMERGIAIEPRLVLNANSECTYEG